SSHCGPHLVMMEPFPAQSRVNPVYRFFIGPGRFSCGSLCRTYCAVLSRSPPGALESAPSRSAFPLASGRPQSASSLLARRKLLARQSRRRRALRLAGGGSAVGAELGGEGR